MARAINSGMSQWREIRERGTVRERERLVANTTLEVTPNCSVLDPKQVELDHRSTSTSLVCPPWSWCTKLLKAKRVVWLHTILHFENDNLFLTEKSYDIHIGQFRLLMLLHLLLCFIIFTYTCLLIVEIKGIFHNHIKIDPFSTHPQGPNWIWFPSGRIIQLDW